MRRSRPLAMLVRSAVALGGAIVMSAPSGVRAESGTAQAPGRTATADAPARTVTVKGTGQDNLRFSSTARRRSATRWCLDLTVLSTVDDGGGSGTVDWGGEGFCGTLRRETAQQIALACPYGVGATGIVEGRPSRVEFVSASGATARVVTKRVADRSGEGTLWATTVAVASLPGRVVVRENGRARTVAELDVLTDICV